MNRQLLTAATAANGQPSGATAGVALRKADARDTGGLRDAEDDCILAITGTKTGGTLLATFRLWAYVGELATWVPFGPGGDTTKGTVNSGAAIGESFNPGASGEIRHSERVQGLRDFTRLYLELLAGFTGTTATFNAYITRRG